MIITVFGDLLITMVDTWTGWKVLGNNHLRLHESIVSISQPASGERACMQVHSGACAVSLGEPSPQQTNDIKMPKFVFYTA